MVELPNLMSAVLLTGHGGFDKLEYRSDVSVPSPGPDEVLIEVLAAGVNNTDINTRIGWYSKSVSGPTGSDHQAVTGPGEPVDDDGSWSGEPLHFPRIQGADCCGRIVAVGAGVADARIGQRVLVRTMQEVRGEPKRFHTITFGSEIDGAFAQYTVARASEAYTVDCDWSDVELASIPCAYSTAENMLHRVGLGAERVLITGASGGVGSAAVQLAKRRGATVVAVAGASKADAVAQLGADRVIDRPTLHGADGGVDLVAELGPQSVDVVVDLVAGPAWPQLLDVLARGGRYVAAGAIAGPIVDLDVRTLYLQDLTLLGATYQDPVVFQNLIRYIEGGEIQPVVAATYPLAEIVEAQKAFLAKGFVGKLVLVP